MNKKLSLLLLPLLFFLIGCGDYQRSVPLGGGIYLPLKEDRTLRYRLTENGETQEYSMRLRYLGGKSYKVYKAYFEGDSPGGLEFTSHEKQVVATTQFSLTSLYSRRERGDFQQIWIDESKQPGDSWMDLDTGTETVFAGFDEVTVPAGTFNDCYLTVTEVVPELYDSIEVRFQRGEMDESMRKQELENAEIVVSRWFARDVGLVKETYQGADYAVELLAIENEGWYTADTTSNKEQ